MNEESYKFSHEREIEFKIHKMFTNLVNSDWLNKVLGRSIHQKLIFCSHKKCFKIKLGTHLNCIFKLNVVKCIVTLKVLGGSI